jgi:hypothetical protein
MNRESGEGGGGLLGGGETGGKRAPVLGLGGA